MILSAQRLKDFLFLRTPSEGCWNWRGYAGQKSYGAFYVSGKMRRAHHVAYFIAYGVEPRYILHSCDNKSCVNPAHLREGTHQDNMKEMAQRKRMPQARKTHCVNGHELSKENLYEKYLPKRMCKICIRARALARSRMP